MNGTCRSARHSRRASTTNHPVASSVMAYQAHSGSGLRSHAARVAGTAVAGAAASLLPT